MLGAMVNLLRGLLGVVKGEALQKIWNLIKGKLFSDPQSLLSVLGFATGAFKWLVGIFISPWGKIVSIIILGLSVGIGGAYLGYKVAKPKQELVVEVNKVNKNLMDTLEREQERNNELLQHFQESTTEAVKADDKLNKSKKELKSEKNIITDTAKSVGNTDDSKRLQQLREAGNKKLKQYH